MKFKPTDKSGGVSVEMGPRDERLPGEVSVEKIPVFKVKSILVPVDFSGCSRKALAYAIPFAEQFDAELTLVHVVSPFVPVPEMAPVDVETLQDGRRELARLRKMIPEAVPSRTTLRTGVPHLEIVQVAKELGIDLIILSTHGRTGFARAFLGSTAEKVVRHAACPVLVVREHEHEFLPEDRSAAQVASPQPAGEPGSA